ncbi:hypothetical protein DFH06DRAFT_1471614 [Mycena polygramma]|nr:hypothetical protein DFH06DRAFT_1471614 [Mycena polygramma]
MFSLNKAFVLVAALFTAVNAQDFVAFSGNSCDGSPGLDVACDGTCFDFTGRHSFEVTSGSNVCVTMWEGPGCTNELFNFGSEAHGVCINVNTGTPVDSFSCVHC